MSSWVRYVGSLPETMKDLGPKPVRHGAHWYTRVEGGAVFRAVADLNAMGAATTDLQNQLGGPQQAGDTYLGEGDYAGALQSYQAGGQAGATSLGPEIDAAGAPTATQPLTQQAWTLNSQLAALAIDPSAADGGLSVASSAQALLAKMVSLYQQAIAAGTTALATQASPQGKDSAADVALQNAAANLLNALTSNAVVHNVPNAFVSAFQQAFNADGALGSGVLSVDGEYGAGASATQQALQRTLSYTFPGGGTMGGTAPMLAATGGTSPSPSPSPTPKPTPTPTPTPTAQTTTGLPTWAKWLLGAAAVLGVGIMARAWYAKKHHEPFLGHWAPHRHLALAEGSRTVKPRRKTGRKAKRK